MTRLPSIPYLRAAASLLALALPATPALADNDGTPTALNAEASRRTVYQADFFTQFAPTTALDIVRRVPGFVLEQSDGEVRGFSGAAGNVVFNGARPSSKSESLEAILARIPARRVLRIEVAPGDQFGSDYAGKSQVLNVVVSQASGIDGNVKVTVGRTFTGPLLGDVEGSVLLRTGGSTFNLSAGLGRSGDVEEGYDDLRLLSDGSRIELREKVNDIDLHDPFVAASWAHESGPGRAEHLNLRYSPGHLTLHQRNHLTPASGPVRDDRLEQDYRNTNYELGGDISRPLGAGVIKFVALGNRRERDNYDAYFNRIGSETTGGFEQLQDARYDEVLGRLSWTHPRLLGFSAEFGTELAYNRLENATDLFALGAGGTRTPIDLPIARATVDELRGEGYLNLGRALTGRLRLDTTLGFETSKLRVRGDTTADRALSYFKPGFTLDWKGKNGWHVQAGLRREVAQLDFYDFISAAELTNDRINGGNANLVPQQSWEARLTIERPVLGRGLVKLELGHDWISDKQDRILTEDGFDAPGNIGSATRRFARLTFDAPLDRLGLKATRINLAGGLQGTRVRDPLTHLMRDWSGFRPDWDWSIDLRRDLSKWSYGFSLSRQAASTIFRIDEIDSFSNTRSFATTFVEYRPDKRTTLRLDLSNVLDSAGERFRLFYDPNRTTGVPLVSEFRHRDSHVGVNVSVNRTFGSGSG